MIAMKDDDKRHEDIDIDATTFSFQSAERRNVYQYLRLTFPDWASIGDIANNIGSDYGNVKGALQGDGERYSTKFALKKVGLVESKKRTLGKVIVVQYRAKRKGSRTRIRDEKKNN